MEFLVDLDHRVFETLNNSWSNAFFDWLMPLITDLHKSPVFLVALLPLIGWWVWKQKAFALKCLLALLIAIGGADLFSYRVVKASVLRDRPSEAGVSVVLRTHHHSGTSFPSNHTANMFAAATLMTFAVPAVGPWFFLIAVMIGYSRIYVGVHFPLDVLGGAVIGVVIAALVWLLMRRWIFKASGETKSAEGSFRARS